MTANRNNDLLAACVWAVLTLLVVRFTDSVFLRALMSAPLLFFLTGHALLRAIGPIRTSLSEHVAYALGASIAICVIGGFVLNWAAWLTPVGWAVWLAAVTCSAALVGMRRSHDAGGVLSAMHPPNLRRWHVATLGMAALITCGAYFLAVRDEANQSQFKYTEFWMLYGANAAPGQLLVGIKSGEAGPERFDVEVALDGQTIAMWRSLALAPGNSWTQKIAVALSGGDWHRAEARLYRPNENVLYRKVSAMIPGA
ncbi:MAG: hypothetical protein WCF20_08160 [Methylovirgula sp.]